MKSKLETDFAAVFFFVAGKTGKENILFNFFNDFLWVGQKIV